MSSGVRYKYQGSGIHILVAYDADSPSNSISAITKANPAVVTSSAHGLASGDVIYIDGGGTMVEVNNRAFIIDRIDANSFRLLDTNSTGYTTYTSGGRFDVGRFSEQCENTAVTQTGDAAAQIPASTVCSTEQEFETGLSGQGTSEFSFHHAPLTAVQVAIKTFRQSGQTAAWKIVLPGSGGTMTQLGTWINQSMSASVDGLWTGSATFRNTGPRDDRVTV